MTQVTTEESFAGGITPRTKARASLDKHRYTDTSVAAAEWDAIWTRCWLFAGLVSDLPDPGDYFVYELARESIVVIRDANGEIGAFYNVCQHRGNRLFTNESGSVRQVACPYHGWRYGLDGELVEVPDADRFCPSVEKSERSLQPVKLEIWAGTVWVNMDAGAKPLADFLGPIMDNLAA